MVNASYKIHAVVTYNDCKVSSNTLTITIGSGVSSEDVYKRQVTGPAPAMELN